MVSLCLLYHRRPLPGTIGLHAFHCHYLRSSFRSSHVVVLHDEEAKLESSRHNRSCGRITDVDMWRMDLRDIYR